MDEVSLACLDIDPLDTLLGVLGILILYLCYWMFLQVYSTLWKNAYVQKNQGRLTKKRKGAFRGQKKCKRDIEEERKLLSILKSPVNQYDDIPSFRKLLCPDPLCHVCNRTAAKVSRLLLRASLEKDVVSVSGLASTASMKRSPFTCSTNSPEHSTPTTSPEPCLSSSSNVSLNKVTSFKNLPPPLPPGERQSLSISPMDSQLWVDPYPPRISPCPCNTQETRLIRRQDTALCLVDSLDVLPAYEPTTTDIDGSSLSRSKLSMLQPHADHLPPPSLAQYHRDQELPDLDSLVSSFERDTTTYIINAETPSFICSDVLTLLERQIRTRGDFLMSEDKEDKTQSFPKQSKPECQPNVSRELLQSDADQQDSTVSLPFASSTGKLGIFHMHQQPPLHPKIFEDHSEKKSTQLFWGLPSLHCESLSSTVPASGDCPSTCFNRIIHAYSTHKTTVISCRTTLSLPQIHLQALSEAILQSPSQHLPSDQFQTQHEVVPPSGSQLCTCGVRFHMPQSEAQLLTPSQIDSLEYTVLQKVQKNIWGLPPVIQKSQEDFCPPAPQFSFAKQTCNAHESSVSIPPGDFPLDHKLRKKLEHHLRKRLIQHRWGLPHRIISSLSLMSPLTDIPQNTETKSSYGLTWIPSFTHSSSKDLNKVELKQLEKHQEQFHERSSEIPSPEKEVKEQGPHSQTGHIDHPLSHPKVAPDDLPVPDTHTDQERLLGSHAGYNSSTLEASRQRREALEVHLRKKFNEISKGQIPETVQVSRHSVKMKFSENFPSQVKEKDVMPLERKDSSLRSFSYVEKKKILEDYMKIFHWRMVNGLPQKVQESIEIFSVKEFPTHSYLQIPSSDIISGANSKTEASGPLIGHSNTFHEDTMKTTNVPIVDNPPSATLPLGKREQKVLQKSPLNTNHQFTENNLTVEDNKPTVNSVDKGGQKETVDSSMLSRRQAGTEPEILDKNEGSSNNTKKFQRKMNLPHFPMIDKSKELVQGASQSQSNIFMTKKLGSSPVANVSSHEVEATLTTKTSPVGISVPDSISIAEFRNNLLKELKFKLEEMKQRQIQEAPADPSSTSDKGTIQGAIQTLLTHHQGVPSGDTTAFQIFHVQSCNSMQQQQEPWVPSHMIPECQEENCPSTIQTLCNHDQGVPSEDTAASQVLHVQLHNTRTSIEQQQQQEPWVPSHIIPKCQEKNFPSNTMKVNPMVSKPCGLDRGNVGLEKSQLRRKSRPPPDRSEKTLRSKSSPALSQKGKPPPENSFKNQVKQIFQWLSPGTTLKGQESSLGKSSSSSALARSLGKAAFSRNTKSQKVTKDVDQVLLEKQGCSRHAVDVTCPKGPISSSVKFDKTQQKVELKVQTETLQIDTSNYRATYSEVINNSSSQEAATAAQHNPMRNRCIKDRARQPQKNVPSQDQALRQRHPESMPYKEQGPKQTPTTRKHQLGQVPPAAPTFAEGTVLGDLSLLFKQKRLFQNFQRERFLSPK